MATGSYEGSSAVEGTSGRHEPSAFTSRWSRRPWRLRHAGNDRERLTRARATEDRAKALSTFRGRERRDRGVRGMIDSRRRGKKTPTLLGSRTGHGAREEEAKTGSACLATIRRSVLECRENTRSLDQADGAQDSVSVHAVKAAERVENARSTGARTSIRWQKSVRPGGESMVSKMPACQAAIRETQATLARADRRRVGGSGECQRRQNCKAGPVHGSSPW